MKRVTVAVPLYRKLEYLPSVFSCLNRQDYPDLDILISDNGCNGTDLEKLVSHHLTRPYRYRRNSRTVGISEHFNQLVEAAEGEYFVLLSDDDLLSSNFVSATASVLYREPDVGVAIARTRRINEVGIPLASSGSLVEPPARMEGLEFIRFWCDSPTDFVCFVSNLARTDEIRAVGGYPILEHGTSIDNALMVKLSFGRRVAWVAEALFEYRTFESSYGLALPPSRLAGDMKAFLHYLDEDPVLQRYARERPEDWSTAKTLLTRMTWRTYRHRWMNMYRDRLSISQWLLAALQMPWIPEYYASVSRTILKRGRSAVGRRLRGARPPEGRGVRS